MTTKLKVYTNEDDALLFWSIPAPIDRCRGFAISRRKKNAKGEKTEDFLLNRTGFEDEVVRATQREGQAVVTKPSTEWPFQRFSWTDHDANTGDTVSYMVIPMIRDDQGKLQQLGSDASDWSPPTTLGSKRGSKFKAFFNRGFIISQFMSRFLAEKKLSPKQFKDNLGEQDEETIRTFLSGDLRLAVLDQMKTAFDEKGEIHAALFELSDDELLKALSGLGGNAHVVLANGSVKKKGDDENEAARQTLEAAGVDVEMDNRFVAPGPLAHNKFIVRSNRQGKPVAAWTGSMNWTPTGLCTQVNNGLLIEDDEIAQIYRDQWQRLREASSKFPPELVDENTKPKNVGDDTPGQVRSTIWFTRAKKGVDLDALSEEVNKARKGVLFLMFMPGSAGLFSTVAARSREPDLYVRGVVSELPNGRGDESSVDVNLIGDAKSTPLHLDIIQPEGIKHPFGNFVAEVTHKQFIGSIGHAIVHSKIVVIDPFSDDPVVITGSHNFSPSASKKNDENFIIIKGDRELAQAYAVNIMGAYAHYRWRAFLQQTDKPFNGLKDNDTWQAKKLASERSELQFWGV